MDLGEYIKVLRKEKKLSQRELSKKSGISNAEISRIETKERLKPSPDVLRALSSALDIKYEILMDKAGYTNNLLSYIIENKFMEEKFLDLITPKLIRDDWILKSLNKSTIADILAIKNDTYWYIDFKFTKTNLKRERKFKDKFLAKQIALRTYGSIALCDEPITKFTLAVSQEELFNELKTFIPKHIDINISLMLINFQTNSILEEFILK